MGKSKKTLYELTKLIGRGKQEGLQTKNIIIKAIIIVVTLLVLTIFNTIKVGDERNSLNFALQVGSIWPHKTLIADFSFPIYKDRNEYLKEVERAKYKVPPVFLSKSNAFLECSNKIDSISYVVFNSNFSPNVIGEVFQSVEFFQSSSSNPKEKSIEFQRLITSLKKFLNTAFQRGIININLNAIRNNEIIVLNEQNNTERILPTKSIYDRQKLLNELRVFLQSSFQSNAVSLGVEIASKLPLFSLVFSPEFTEQKLKLAEMSVPKTKGYVRKGEVIVEKGKKITEDILLKLKSYERVKLMITKESYSFGNLLGSFLNVLFIYAILLIYLIILRKRIFADNWQFGIISFCVVLIGFISWISFSVVSDLPLRFLIFLPSIAILLAIIFDSRTAFYSTVTIAMLVAIIRGNDFETASILMFASIIGAYSVRDIQSRTQMFRSMLFIVIGFFITISAFALQRSALIENFFESISLATLNAILSPVIAYGLLFLIEKLSNITSDLKLKEFDNLNHPLLKKLAEVAPGTYQHTLSMAILAENCATAIGANRLLTRVGAYFHDVGKIYKPEYFIENQMDIDNKHEHMSPLRSAEVIREHVIKGIEIAKEYNLPPRIIDFIPMHHGTSLIKHFYAKALESSPNNVVNEDDYRYPGPKPNSKETAIVMICDSAEAMSRLPKRSREELSKAIQRLIQDKILDGQFDESNITMSDLKIIQEVCVRHLYGYAHPRVEYKEIPLNNNEQKDSV